MPRFRIPGSRYPATLTGLLALFAFFGGSLEAQTQTNEKIPAGTQNQTAFQLRVASNLVVVRVVVRDAQGKPIEGLRKEDFHLFDRGKEQTITQFEVGTSATQSANPSSAVATGQSLAAVVPTAATPLRFLALYFDDLHMSDTDLIQVREAADHYLAANLRPEDRVGIFTSGGTLSDFTSDSKMIREALTKLHASPKAGRMPACPDLSDYQAFAIVNNTDPDAMAVALDEKRRICDMGGSMDPDPEKYVRMLAHTVVEQDENRARADLGELDEVVKYISHMPGQRTVVLVSPGFLSQNEQLQIDGIIDDALRSETVISVLDARGLAVLLSEVDVSQSSLPSGTLLGAVHSLNTGREMFAADALAEVAQGTGGEFFHNDNDLKAGFGALVDAPVSYILAFAPTDMKPDGRFHELNVTLTEQHKGFILQARRGYFAAKQAAVAETAPQGEAQAQAVTATDPETKERIREAMFSSVDPQQLPVEVRTEVSKAADNGALQVLAHLDTRSLHFHKEGARNQNTVIFVSAILDRSGNLVTGQQWQAKVDVPDDALPKLLSDGIDVKMSFQLKPGTYTIREVVTDSEEHHMTSFSRSVEIR